MYSAANALVPAGLPEMVCCQYLGPFTFTSATWRNHKPGNALYAHRL
jgi:hypothetical protein